MRVRKSALTVRLGLLIVSIVIMSLANAQCDMKPMGGDGDMVLGDGDDMKPMGGDGDMMPKVVACVEAMPKNDAGQKDGEWVTCISISPGVVDERINYRNGVKEGTHTQYYDDGARKAVTNYKNDIKHGEEIIYLPSGAKLLLYTYKNGVLHGNYAAYDGSGDAMSNCETCGMYANGKKTRRWVEVDGNGHLHRGSYKVGVKDGIWTRSTKAGEALGAKKWENGVCYDYDSVNGGLVTDPCPGDYAGGKKTGHWIEIDDSNHLHRGSYKEGVRDGVWTRSTKAGEVLEARKWEAGVCKLFDSDTGLTTGLCPEE